MNDRRSGNGREGEIEVVVVGKLGGCAWLEWTRPGLRSAEMQCKSEGDAAVGDDEDPRMQTLKDLPLKSCRLNQCFSGTAICFIV